MWAAKRHKIFFKRIFLPQFFFLFHWTQFNGRHKNSIEHCWTSVERRKLIQMLSNNYFAYECVCVFPKYDDAQPFKISNCCHTFVCKLIFTWSVMNNALKLKQFHIQNVNVRNVFGIIWTVWESTEWNVHRITEILA